MLGEVAFVTGEDLTLYPPSQLGGIYRTTAIDEGQSAHYPLDVEVLGEDVARRRIRQS
jgi:hypothetical protein